MPEFSALLGNRCLAHPKITPTLIEIVNPDHPLVSGVPAFVTTDEIYVSELADGLEVIMDAPYDGPCPGFETQQVAGRTRHPVLFSRPEGNGAVVSFTLGHCRGRFDVAEQGIDDLGVTAAAAWESPEFRAVLRRCVDWAVHGDEVARCYPGDEYSKEQQ